MANNIVDQIGSVVTVWTKDGNAMERRTLLTVDEIGIVVTGFQDGNKAVFVPWVQVKYVDYESAESKKKKTDIKEEVKKAFGNPTHGGINYTKTPDGYIQYDNNLLLSDKIKWEFNHIWGIKDDGYKGK